MSEAQALLADIADAILTELRHTEPSYGRDVADDTEDQEAAA